MRPKALLHEVMIMRFLDVNDRFRKNKLSCGEAAEILGVSISTLKYKGKTIQIEPDKTHLHYVKCKVRVHEYPDGELAVFAGPRKLKSSVLEERQNKEVDDSDEFIALGPIPVWENEDGEAATSPNSGLGRTFGAQVALQRCLSSERRILHR